MSKIEWTEKTINCVTGCSYCSPGCRNCYAEKMTQRLKAMGQEKYAQGFNVVTCHPDVLDQLSPKQKPAVYFVNSMSDTFHDKVDDDFIGELYNTMFACHQHTFIVLTKRAERMGTFLSEVGIEIPDHIWHGATVCNQEEADAKIPHLLNVPGKRFLSIEPMLGPIDLTTTGFLGCDCRAGECLGICNWYSSATDPSKRDHQVILGGESGPGARPLHPNWVRGVRDQCESAGVPFMFKQDSGTRPNKLPELDGAKHDSLIWG